MAKFNYKTGGAELGSDLMQVGTVGAGMIVSNQLLDFRKIFKSMYEKNPDAGWIKHQGGIKLGVGAGAAFLLPAMMNKKLHPALKGLLIGLMLQGAFQEARVLTTGKDGAPSPLEQLGAGEGANLEDLDKLMREAAMSGDPGQYNATTGIGAGGDQMSVDLMQNASSGIGFAWDYLPQNRV